MMTDPAAFTVNLNLEVTTGCAYSCPGCTVDKDGANMTVDPEIRDLLDLAREVNASGWRTQELKIGPTDMISAGNGFALLRDPLIKELMSHFNLLSIALAMLNDNGLQELADILEEMMPGKYLMVGTPVTLKNLMNEKYMNILRDRFARFRGMLKTITFNRVYVNINVDEDSLKQFNDKTFDAITNIGLGDFDSIEFVFVDVRRGFDNIMNAERFKRVTREFAHFVLEREKRVEGSRVFSRLVPRSDEGFEFTYRTGQLYSTINIVETLTLFNENNAIAKPWTMDRLIEFRTDQYANNLMRYVDHPECGDCCYLDNCARNNIQVLMEEVNSDKCLFDIKNRWEPACHLVNPEIDK